MDATQMISDSTLESDEEENEETSDNPRGRPVAKLCVLKNEHISETELPLFLGDNVLGRDPNTCTLPLSAASVSKQHAIICISVYRGRGCHTEDQMEALLWDLGSTNGTRKGRLKLTPNVRYALSGGDSVVVADIPCQYVICGADSVVSSQEDTRTPVSRNPSVKARVTDDLRVREGDTCTGSEKRVNGGTKPRVSQTKTLVRASCLSFEQTPTHPQQTLVPESDSDSDGETAGGGERRCVALVSDSDSHKSSPICSTFLSPTNKVIPESEDESPITPSSSTKNRPCKHVSLSTEETDVDLGRHQLKKKVTLVLVDDSEAEEEEEEERAAQRATKSKESGENVTMKQESNGCTGKDELPVSTPAVSTDCTPAFDIDSDTDMEEEEEGVASAGPSTLNTNQQVDQPPNTVQFHMDSDTDIEEDHDMLGKVPKTLPSSNENTKPPHCSLVIQSEDISTDSNTDVDEDAAVLTDAAMKAKPASSQIAQIADSASSMQIHDFHLDSDTDVDEEEEEGECETEKTDETVNKLDMKVIRPESAAAAPHSLHLDADDEAIPASTISEPTVAAAVRESCSSANAGAVLDTLSDGDTDVEDNPPVGVPAAVTTCKTSEALQSDSGADTDVDESSMPPAGDRAHLPHLRVDSDKDVEDKEAGIKEAGEDQIPSLHRENTPGFLVPLLPNCSTPIQLSAASSGELSSCSDIQEDVDFAVAETQVFALEASDYKEDQSSSRGESLQLGLSDSSHLQCHNQTLATEATQPFFSVEGDVISEATNTCAAVSTADGLSAEDDLHLEVTEAHAENEDSDRCSVASKNVESQSDLALEATQAYISVLDSDPDDNTNQDEGQNTPATETPPIVSAFAFAETQLMPFHVEEQSLAVDNSVCSVQQVNPRTQTKMEEREENGKDAHPQERNHSEAQYMAATQPICTSSNEESDDDSLPGPRRRKAKPLQLSEEQTQCLIDSNADGSQATAISEDHESGDMDLKPGPKKQKTKQLEEETQPLTSSEVSTVESQSLHTNSLQLEDGKTQPSTSSNISAVETQQIVTSKEQDSDGPQRRTVKQLHLTEDNRQHSELSAAENQPIATCEDDAADSMLGPRKRKAKHLEDKTQLLTSNEVFADDDSVPVLPKRKATLQLEKEETQSEMSPVDTQPLKTTTGLKSQKRKRIESTAETTRASARNLRTSRSREGEEQAECSVPPKRQTRGGDKSLQNTKEFRGKARSDDDKNGEEVKQAKQARGRKNTRQQKDDNEEKEMLGMEGNTHTVNKSKQKEGKQQEREKTEKEAKETVGRKEEQEETERQDGREEKEKIENERKVNKEKSQQENEEEVKPKAPARSRRSTRAMASQHPPQNEQDSTASTNDDFPARRTRSRSNSSNSISSERSVSSVNTQESKGSGRGRGAKTPSKSPQAAIVRTSYRRATVAAGPTEQDSSDVLPQRLLSKNNSSNSRSPEVSSCSVRSLNRGRRGRKAEPDPDFIPAVTHHSDQNSASKLTARGRKSRRLEGSSSEVLSGNEKEKADSQQTRTTRGRQHSECAAADETDQSPHQEGCASEELLLPKRNVRGRSQKAVRSEAVEESVTSTASGDRAKNRGRGRKTELKANTGADYGQSTSISKGMDETPNTEAADEEGKNKTEIPAAIQVKSASSTPSTQAKKNAKDFQPEMEVKESETIQVQTVEKRPRSRPSALQKERKKNEGLEESEASVTSTSQNSNEDTTEPQTPISSRSRKRQAFADSSPVAKSPRHSSASPAATGRLRVPSLAYKVLFTGVVDEAGEKVLARLGGSMAKGIADMNCLVTDKVRRTVKFLCAVAKGIPIVTTDWLEKSGKAGSFLSPNAFVVKDPEQEKKFTFCLQDSLRTASSQPLLQGYNIHVTKSVKPEPVHMKDIISSSGANFLPKMPTSNKPHTVVISCEEDWLLCGPAVSASIPVVTAEFILTGILQQKLDFQYHELSPPAAALQSPAGGKGRGRRKT
ncbi:mediator of DNA damage checkpoint protein 1 isoform X1 [Amphiprion ocellaris]|uniref:Mediator of DNA damage checkpoint protein 1 n=1 Tax=Amphiprion ocellaris TaxID=80972 RepID=A0AAQ5YLI3_AMPOC|nr:mediator of DNA damage checkpoint protein 1 isoform X1 [Amphiprion ocellaris]